MNPSHLEKKKRITHIGKVSDSYSMNESDLSSCIDCVSDIMKGMDSSINISEHNIYPHNKFNMSKVEETTLNIRDGSENNLIATGDFPVFKHKHRKQQKILSVQKVFPLMAKCQKNLKYIRHNQCIPKQRAHISSHLKSPLKSVKNISQRKVHQNTKNKFRKSNNVEKCLLKSKYQSSLDMKNSSNYQNLPENERDGHVNKVKKHSTFEKLSLSKEEISDKKEQNMTNVYFSESSNECHIEQDGCTMSDDSEPLNNSENESASKNTSSDSDNEYEKFIALHKSTKKSSAKHKLHKRTIKSSDSESELESYRSKHKKRKKDKNTTKIKNDTLKNINKNESFIKTKEFEAKCSVSAKKTYFSETNKCFYKKQKSSDTQKNVNNEQNCEVFEDSLVKKNYLNSTHISSNSIPDENVRLPPNASFQKLNSCTVLLTRDPNIDELALSTSVKKLNSEQMSVNLIGNKINYLPEIIDISCDDEQSIEQNFTTINQVNMSLSAKQTEKAESISTNKYNEKASLVDCDIEIIEEKTCATNNSNHIIINNTLNRSNSSHSLVDNSQKANKSLQFPNSISSENSKNENSLSSSVVISQKKNSETKIKCAEQTFESISDKSNLFLTISARKDVKEIANDHIIQSQKKDVCLQSKNIFPKNEESDDDCIFLEEKKVCLSSKVSASVINKCSTSNNEENVITVSNYDKTADLVKNSTQKLKTISGENAKNSSENTNIFTESLPSNNIKETYKNKNVLEISVKKNDILCHLSKEVPDLDDCVILDEKNVNLVQVSQKVTSEQTSPNSNSKQSADGKGVCQERNEISKMNTTTNIVENCSTSSKMTEENKSVGQQLQSDGVIDIDKLFDVKDLKAILDFVHNVPVSENSNTNSTSSSSSANVDDSESKTNPLASSSYTLNGMLIDDKEAHHHSDKLKLDSVATTNIADHYKSKQTSEILEQSKIVANSVSLGSISKECIDNVPKSALENSLSSIIKHEDEVSVKSEDVNSFISSVLPILSGTTNISCSKSNIKSVDTFQNWGGFSFKNNECLSVNSNKEFENEINVDLPFSGKECLDTSTYKLAECELDKICALNIEEMKAKNPNLISLLDSFKKEYDCYRKLMSAGASFKWMLESQYKKINFIGYTIQKAVNTDYSYHRYLNMPVINDDQSQTTSSICVSVPAEIPVNVKVECPDDFSIPSSSGYKKEVSDNICDFQRNAKSSVTTLPTMQDPSPEELEILRSKCVACGKQAVAACKDCQEVFYCSDECGFKFWNSRHKYVCQKKKQ